MTTIRTVKIKENYFTNFFASISSELSIAERFLANKGMMSVIENGFLH